MELSRKSLPIRLYPTALQKYFEHPTCRVAKESSRRSLRSTVQLFNQDHPDLELHELTKRHLEDWLGKRLQSGVSDSTVNKNAKHLNSLLEWAWRQGHIKENPARGVQRTLKLRPKPVREHRWLNEDQAQTILDSFQTLTNLDLRDALILRLGFNAGLRNDEIRSLPLSALARIGDQRITVVGKNDRIAQVSVSPRTTELLVAWKTEYERGWHELGRGNLSETAPVIVGFKNLNDWNTGQRSLVPQWGKGITQQALGKIVAKRTAAAGYRIAPHDMRRSFAGMIYERSGLEKTSDALRHSSLETTRLYIKQRQDAAALAVEEAGLRLR